MASATAKERGYFGVIREPGEGFEVPDGTASNSWFDVEGYTEPSKRAKASAPAPVIEVQETTPRPTDQDLI